MPFFRRIALHRFAKAHPPAHLVAPASPELIAAYAGLLPASLLELWRCKGLGLYGERQLTLIDPRPWQGMLDRWLISPPDGMLRIPIALTPLGGLIYYRKLGDTGEDVACIDPIAKESTVVALSIDAFFNDALCNASVVDALIAPQQVAAASLQCGPLAPGEAYEVDPLLLPVHLLRIAKVNALDMHARLRDAANPPAAKGDRPATLARALPAAHRPFFAQLDFAQPESGAGVAGLYLSSRGNAHRLLALEPGGQFSLLFWHIHEQTFERMEVRSYTGGYTVSTNAQGDACVALDIALRADSLGSDANDDALIVARSGDATLLLRANDLGDIAVAINGRGVLGSSGQYFRSVALSDAFVEEPADGREAPPAHALPGALRALIRSEPLVVRITQVDAPNPDDEDEDTVMCTLDLGESDGLRMNMPLYSPTDSGKNLKGWVWDVNPQACRAGICYECDEDGATVHGGPVVGDVLTDRAPWRWQKPNECA